MATRFSLSLARKRLKKLEVRKKSRNFAARHQNDTTMGKYLDPKADLTFKKIFGEHKNLVISLLNAMLPLKEDERVVSIEYWPTEKIPKRTQVEKDSIVDVCCHDNKKREFIVEMQMTWTESFKKRVLFNASKAYVAQSESGEAYQILQPVYALNFVNEPMHIDADGYYHHYQLVHQENTDEIIDGLQLVFIDLTKFHPASITEKKMQVLWLRFLTEINAHTREVPAEMLENPEVSQALRIVEEAAYTPAEMRAYDKFWDNVSVAKTLEYARKQEHEESQRRFAEADTMMKQADTMIKQAKTQIEQANTIKEEAKTIREEAKTIREEAKTMMEQAEAKAEQAEAKVEQANTKAEQAEAKLKQKDIDTARKMKEFGSDTAFISQVTGLTAKQIEAL